MPLVENIFSKIMDSTYSSDKRSEKKQSAILKSSVVGNNKEIPNSIFQRFFSSVPSNNGCVYKFKNNDGSTETIKLNAHQDKLYKIRLNRRFQCKNLAEYKSRINKAISIDELNLIGKEQNICDICDFNSISLVAAKHGLLAVLDSVVRFPELRSKICFVGSDTAFSTLCQGLKNNDKTIIKKLGLDKIIDSSNINALINIINESISNPNLKSNLAYALYISGFCDGIFIREKYFSEKAYKDTLLNLNHSVNQGFAPKGCYTLKSLIDHEIGHMLDFSRSVSHKKEVITYYQQLSKTEIKNGLSEYAATSISEFIADGYSEFCNHYPPREMAKKVAAFIRDSKN